MARSRLWSWWCLILVVPTVIYATIYMLSVSINARGMTHTTISSENSTFSSDVFEEFVKTRSISNEMKNMPYCHLNANAGPISVDTLSLSLKALQLIPSLSWVRSGGAWGPSEVYEYCRPRSHVAILVAYRDRDEHLAVFLRHLHPFLKRQNLEYRIFIVEQTAGRWFNKGVLFNLGYLEIQRRFPGDFDCVVLQDVDVLPQDDRISYSCKKYAWHLASYVDKWNYTLFYYNLIGGSFQISMSDYRKANGFSNMFFGWGGEDDDFQYRLHKVGIEWKRYPSWSKWLTLRHKQSPGDGVKTRDLLNNVSTRWTRDGLNSVKYDLKAYEERQLYTWMLADIPEKAMFTS